MHTCPNCETHISRAAATRCPHCGTQLGQPPPLSVESKKVRWLAYASLSMALLFLILSLVSPMLQRLYREYYSQPLTLDFALVFSQLGVFLTPISGFFLGALARAALNDSNCNVRDKGLATIGLLVNSTILLSFFAIPFIRSVFSVREHTPRHAVCVESLKHIGTALWMYAEDNAGLFPPIDNRKNNFIFEGDITYPEYIADVSVLHCPQASDYDDSREKSFTLISNDDHSEYPVDTAHPDCMTDKYYCYLGWVVTSDEEAEAFFKAYDKLSPEDYSRNIVVPKGRSNAGGNIIHRLDINAGRLAGEAQATDPNSHKESLIPIMWDRPFMNPRDFSHWYRDGVFGNVLYLDGHVEFVKFGEKFPMTETMARLLEERPRTPIPDCEETEGAD